MVEKRKSKEVEFIPIRSIFMTAYLHSKGYKPIKTETDGIGRIVFYFPKSRELLEQQGKFYSNQALQNFINSYREIKFTMYEGRKDE